MLKLNRKARGGFTLVETAIAVTVLALTLGSVLLMSKQGSAAWRINMVVGNLDAKTERTLDRIMRQVEAASASNILPDLTAVPNSDWIDYQTISGYDGGSVFLTATRRLVLELEPGELDNGVDDNGDGHVDERRVVLVDDPDGADEQRVTIARGVCEFLEGELPNGIDDNGNGLVDESGLCFDLQDDTLNIRVSMQALSPEGQRLVRTLEGALTLQN